MSEVMIDLETMGQGPDAAIVAIGAVFFDTEKQTLGKEFYEVISLQSSADTGGVIDPSTVLWWLQQSEEARAELYGRRINIYNALEKFSMFLGSAPFDGLWGNGANFDNVILRGAYVRMRMTPPWKYWQDRCFRTMRKMLPVVDTSGWETVKHNALADAKWQARYLVEALQK